MQTRAAGCMHAAYILICSSCCEAWHAEYDNCSETLVEMVACTVKVLLQCSLSNVNEMQVKADVNDIINAFCTPDSFKKSSKVIIMADTVSDNVCRIIHM